MEEEFLDKAGAYKLEALTITSEGETYDISNFFIEMHIYEDIYSPALTGTLMVADAINLIVSLPIKGDEILTIKTRTPTLPDTPENIISQEYRIFAITDRSPNGDGSQFYIINFTSLENFNDNVKTISQTFTGTTDDVALQLFEDFIKIKKDIFINDTPHKSKITYTSNFWTPFKNMRFITKRVRGKELKGSDYLFYESNKLFYFTSIEAIIKRQLDNGLFDEYVFERDSQNIPRRESGFDFVGNIFPNEVTRIEKMVFKDNTNMIDSQITGTFASSIYGYDLSTKKFVRRNIDWVEECKPFVRTDSGVPMPSETPRNPLSAVNFVMYNSTLYNSPTIGKYGITDNENLPSQLEAEFYSDRHLYRQSYLNLSTQNVFEIVIPGRTDIQVGALISILYPNTAIPDEETKNVDTLFDPQLTGAYLITAIHHKFDADRHIMTAEVIRNGFKYDL